MPPSSPLEKDVVDEVIVPALVRRGWDPDVQIRRELVMSPGRVMVAGKREQKKQRDVRRRADLVLFYRPNIPVAVIEIKRPVGGTSSARQQALEYADRLDVPLAYTTTGAGFQETDLTTEGKVVDRDIPLEDFPTPDELWRRYCAYKKLDEAARKIAAQDWHLGEAGKEPRYFQIKAVNRAVEAIARGDRNRFLLVMATGTGKTFAAFQIIWRLWKAKVKKRVLFLADRNILLDQARNNDFQPFGGALTKIEHRQADKSYEIYLALYQAVSGSEEARNIYKQFSPGFFDLVIVDECHRGSADESSAWREILEYFSSATQIGLTATPKETTDVSNIAYFGEPLYTYSLKQGIEDGYLAPFKVIRIDTDKDLEGYTPGEGKRDKFGHPVPNRTYVRGDFDRNIVLEQRTELVAQKVTEYLKSTDRFAKTIVFCQDVDHADRMRAALARENADLFRENRRYIRKITGDDPVGKAELSDFIAVRQKHPVIATTSRLLSTGVDTQTCKLIVIDQNIGSMTEFKQIIGRGTRIQEDCPHGPKMWFTILDFRGVTRHFADPAFDGEPVQVYEPKAGEPVTPPDTDEEAAQGPSSDQVRQAREIRRRKPVIDDEDVSVARQTVERHVDGRRIEASLFDHARDCVRALCPSRDDLLARWLSPSLRARLLADLERRGAAVSDVHLELGEDYSVFDVLCQVGHGAPPITRRARAASAAVQTVLQSHGDMQRRVLEGLLTKFANEAVEELDDVNLLRVRPFDKIGTLVEIVRAFGGRPAYEKAVAALERALYEADGGAE
jgi:type I restriction enzyme, R subunit